MMQPYERRVFYYETDQMGIVHHSNYIRWMEEARIDYMHRAGLDYEAMEQTGIIMPVTGVDCRYKISVRFNETIRISVIPDFFNGVRAAFRYEIRNRDGQLKAQASSEHCFLDGQSRRPVNLKKRLPEYAAQLEKLVIKKEAT